MCTAHGCLRDAHSQVVPFIYVVGLPAGSPPVCVKSYHNHQGLGNFQDGLVQCAFRLAVKKKTQKLPSVQNVTTRLINRGQERSKFKSLLSQDASWVTLGQSRCLSQGDSVDKSREGILHITLSNLVV